MRYEDEKIIKQAIDMYCFIQNEAGSCKPSVWKRFVESMTSNKNDVRCCEMDMFFTALKSQLITLIDTVSGKDTKLHNTFLPYHTEPSKIKEYIDTL